MHYKHFTNFPNFPLYNQFKHSHRHTIKNRLSSLFHRTHPKSFNPISKHFQLDYTTPKDHAATPTRASKPQHPHRPPAPATHHPPPGGSRRNGERGVRAEESAEEDSERDRASSVSAAPLSFSLRSRRQTVATLFSFPRTLDFPRTATCCRSRPSDSVFVGFVCHCELGLLGFVLRGRRKSIAFQRDAFSVCAFFNQKFEIFYFLYIIYLNYVCMDIILFIYIMNKHNIWVSVTA